MIATDQHSVICYKSIYIHRGVFYFHVAVFYFHVTHLLSTQRRDREQRQHFVFHLTVIFIVYVYYILYTVLVYVHCLPFWQVFVLSFRL